MKKLSAILILLVLGAVAFSLCSYSVSEQEQVIITQFGKPVGEPIKEAGLKFKLPFVQTVNRIEKRVLEWDGIPNEMPTKDKTYIVVDTFGRWKISDPKQYFLRLGDERRAQSRLDDILGSETRNVIANNNLIEIVRTTKDREPDQDEALVAAGAEMSVLPDIRRGREDLQKEIFERAIGKLDEFGIELLDLRVKRINYNNDVSRTIYQRMISERQQIAERFRSEGAGEAAKILGRSQKEVSKIDSEAYKEVQAIRGAADAKATQIYAEAYNQSPAASEFYGFVKTLETYESLLDSDSTLILSTDSELFGLLKGSDAGKAPQPRRPAPVSNDPFD